MDGGDEWSDACIEQKDIKRFLEDYKNKNIIQFSIFGFEYELSKKYSEYLFSKKAEEDFKKLNETIYRESYYENYKDESEWKNWYETIQTTISDDLALFKSLKVLRINGMQFDNFNFLKELKSLKTLELVETRFLSNENINLLLNLNQLYY